MPFNAAAVDSGRTDMTQAKIEMASAVLRSAGDLLAVDVLELELDLQHVDVPKDLANQSLKLKFRMSGVTYLKSKASTAVNGDENWRVSLDTAGFAVYEGASTLDFELCKARFMGPSTTVARCRVPLKQALRSLNAGGQQSKADAWKLTLWATGTSDKALGTAAVEVRVRTVKLKAAGGMEALKALAVPRPPKVLGNYSAVGMIEIQKACNTFASRAAVAQQCLQEAFDAAQRDAALPKDGPKAAPSQRTTVLLNAPHKTHAALHKDKQDVHVAASSLNRENPGATDSQE